MDCGSRSPGRPRSRQVDEAAFRAAQEIVAAEGYARLTMERAAALAGLGKASLYRRFKSRSELAAEALLHAYPIGPEPAEAGPDAVARHLARIFKAISAAAGPVLQGLMADAQLDPAFREVFRDRFILTRRAALAEAIRLEYGEVQEMELALDLALGAMWYRLLVAHAPLDDDAARQIADSVGRVLRS